MAEPLPLPPGIADARFQAFASIAADHLGRITDALPGLLVYRLDDVDASLLPHLAWQFHVMGEEGWDVAADEASRRALVRSAFELHRYKGTVWAVRTAAKATAGLDVAIEEEPGDARWAAYQIDPGRVLSRDEVRRLATVAGAWGPVRAKLRRVYHGYDLRPIVASGTVALDEGLLDDDSGVDLDGVRQSFGLTHRTATRSGTPDGLPAAATSHWVGAIIYADRMVLDHWAFGDPVVFNHPIVAGELITLSTAGLDRSIGRIGPPLSVPRAALVASESVLGEPNAILGAWAPVEEGEQLVASGTAALSDYRLDAPLVHFDEVFAAAVPATVQPTLTVTPALGGAMHYTAVAAPVPPEAVLDGAPPELVNHPVAGLGAAGATAGPYDAPWPSAPWPDRPWGAAVWPALRGDGMAMAALHGLALPPQGAAGQISRRTAAAVSGLTPSVSVMIWSGSVIPPDQIAFWEIVPWPGSPYGDRIYAGGCDGGWAAQLIPPSKLGISTGPYEPLWPDAAWSSHSWGDPVVSVAVTSTGE